MTAISERDIVQIAQREAALKITEQPADSNRQKYGAAFGWNGVAWCGQFVWWVTLEAGIDLRTHGFPNTSMASTNAIDQIGRRLGWDVPKISARPGDWIIFDFGVTGAGDPGDDADHIGIAVKPHAAGLITTVDGNTSATGSQSNGGAVLERTRSLATVRTVLRPPYAQWTEELKESDMTPDDLLNANVIALDGQKDRKSLAEMVRALRGYALESRAREIAQDAKLETLSAAVAAIAQGSPEAVRQAFSDGMAALDARLAAVKVEVSLH